jgi:hypothetical protein
MASSSSMVTISFVVAAILPGRRQHAGRAFLHRPARDCGERRRPPTALEEDSREEKDGFAAEPEATLRRPECPALALRETRRTCQRSFSAATAPRRENVEAFPNLGNLARAIAEGGKTDEGGRHDAPPIAARATGRAARGARRAMARP